jgi:hypothetical protein
MDLYVRYLNGVIQKNNYERKVELVQTFQKACSGAHPATCPVGTGGPFLGGKARPGRDTDHTPI